MKLSNTRIQYYVEGECEEKLVKTLVAHNLILPGQTDVLNPVQDHIKPTHLRKLPAKTTVVLIFDTDKSYLDILKTNIQFLKKHPNIKQIITIPQVTNLEKELIRCTNVHQIRRLLNCKTNSEFKTAFIEEKHLYEKLQLHRFDFEKLWSEKPSEAFLKAEIRNESKLIKLIDRKHRSYT